MGKNKCDFQMIREKAQTPGMRFIDRIFALDVPVGYD